MELWTLAPLRCAVGFIGSDKNSSRSDDLNGQEIIIRDEEGMVGLRTTLGWAGRTGDTYSNSVRDPRSDRERYSLQAPIDLYSSS
jgi:hypothetical protein